MCGISGLFHPLRAEAPETARLRAMTDAMAHRGPDGTGLHAELHLGLGHLRLAIVDVAGGTQPMFSAARAVVATTALPQMDTGFYRRTISKAEEGEWAYNANLKGDPAFLIRVGWMAAILEGHARVAAGLAIDCPVLVAISGRSDFRRVWAEEFRLADIVLDVDRIAARAPRLGPLVVIARFPDAVHDLVLSGIDVRAKVFAEYSRFLRCYARRPDLQPAEGPRPDDGVGGV